MWWRLRLVTSAVSGVALAASAAGATGGKTFSRRFVVLAR
jgi:hypothetical protein